MNDRTCLVTRACLPKEMMIRFVAGPDSFLAPDLKCNLPGRGCWVKAEQTIIEKAIKKNLFSKALHQEISIPPDFLKFLEALLVKRALGALGLARKAGLIVTGWSKVWSSLCSKKAIAILHAQESSEGSKKKIAEKIYSLSKTEQYSCVIIEKIFTESELSLALGKTNVIHVACLQGGQSSIAFRHMESLRYYRQECGKKKSEQGFDNTSDVKGMG